MKKQILLAASAVMVAFAASAQNKAFDDVSKKYSDREGITVVNMEGELLKGLSSMLGASGTISVEEGDTQKLSEVCESISSITVITSDEFDARFARDVKRAVDSSGYTPLLTNSSESETVKIATADIKQGKYKDQKEIVIAVFEEDETTFIRVIGRMDAETLSKIAAGISA